MRRLVLLTAVAITACDEAQSDALFGTSDQGRFALALDTQWPSGDIPKYSFTSFVHIRDRIRGTTVGFIMFELHGLMDRDGDVVPRGSIETVRLEPQVRLQPGIVVERQKSCGRERGTLYCDLTFDVGFGRLGDSPDEMAWLTRVFRVSALESPIETIDFRVRIRPPELDYIFEPVRTETRFRLEERTQLRRDFHEVFISDPSGEEPSWWLESTSLVPVSRQVGLIHSRGPTTRGGYDGKDGFEGRPRDACAATVHG